MVEFQFHTLPQLLQLGAHRGEKAEHRVDHAPPLVAADL
jgi:hypothetical protein